MWYDVYFIRCLIDHQPGVIEDQVDTAFIPLRDQDQHHLYRYIKVIDAAMLNQKELFYLATWYMFISQYYTCIFSRLLMKGIKSYLLVYGLDLSPIYIGSGSRRSRKTEMYPMVDSENTKLHIICVFKIFINKNIWWNTTL